MTFSDAKENVINKILASVKELTMKGIQNSILDTLTFPGSVIYEAVWKGPGDKCGLAVVNVVSQIRRKIGERYIEVVVGSGYRFVGR